MSKEEEAQLRGLSKIFNSVTINGRANVAKATYACMAGIIAYFVFKPKGAPVIDKKVEAPCPPPPPPKPEVPYVSKCSKESLGSSKANVEKCTPLISLPRKPQVPYTLPKPCPPPEPPKATVSSVPNCSSESPKADVPPIPEPTSKPDASCASG